MPRNVGDNGRIDFRIPPEAKAMIARAEDLALSERDSLRILDLLEIPTSPTNRLIRAAKAGQTLA